VLKMKYEKQLVFVRFVGTHTDYDAINVEEV
jgi:mRNA-degrading endonuclease HigB of HigAB toxin-antitoxin module